MLGLRSTLLYAALVLLARVVTRDGGHCRLAAGGLCSRRIEPRQYEAPHGYGRKNCWLGLWAELEGRLSTHRQKLVLVSD
jgi:hypothetical protein